MASVLLQLHIDTSLKCAFWTGVPASHGVDIKIYAPSSILYQVKNCADECYSLLDQALRRAGGRRGPLSHIDKSILIYISDGTGAIDPAVEAYYSIPGSIVIPVVDTAFNVLMPAALPLSFQYIRAEEMRSFDIRPLIPMILRKAGILNDRLSLFISYRHEDAKAIAGQLFHALSEKMFDVFLDRFSGRPGDNFVALVKEELVDKSCVLVLETPNIGRSAFCRQEVGIATTYYLGLLAVDLPGSAKSFPVIAKRLDLSGTMLAPDSALGQTDLDKLIAFILKHFDSEILRRIRMQDQTLHDAIVKSRLTPDQVEIGQYKVIKNKKTHLLSMSSRPPGTTAFVELEARAKQQSSQGRTYLFGPLSQVRSLRAARIAWLANKSQITAVDEGSLMRYLAKI